MIVTEFDDEWGHHIHESYGMPYDPNRPITCTACRFTILAWRQELCNKYNWSYWPADISACRFK